MNWNTDATDDIVMKQGNRFMSNTNYESKMMFYKEQNYILKS